MQRITINVEDELKEILSRRADFQRRSLSREIIFLVETALAHEEQTNIALLRMQMQAGDLSEHPPE